jgi:uracil-DNA glycosylase family 4
MYLERKSSECSKCPLRDKRRVWGQGSLSWKIALIGEAPGVDEDACGIPFSGKAGGMLNWGLGAAGMLRHQIWLTNTTSCRPPNNDLGGFEGAEAKCRCAPGFTEELAFLKKQGVRVLIPLGNEALEALGINDKITKARGSVYLRDGFIVIPTFHPSYIMRSQHKKDSASVTYKYVWVADLKKAKTIAEKGSWVPPVENFILNPDLPTALAWIQEATSSSTPIAVDIETTGITPDTGTTVVIGLAKSATNAISIPILKKGGDPYWHNGDFQQVKNALERLFARGNLIFQNSLFDVLFLRGDGYRIGFESVKHDTLVLHHALSPELPHSLDFIVSIYGDTPYWKGEAKERKGRILDADETELRRYNLRDCVVLHQILPEMLEELHELGGEDCYYQEAIPLLAAVGEMIETGIIVDTNEVGKVKEGWKSELEKRAGCLRKLASLPRSFNLESDDDVRWLLWGVEPAKFAKIANLDSYLPEATSGKKPRKTGTKVHAELLALQELRDGTTPLYRLSGFGGKKTKSGEKIAVDKQGLLSLTIALQNRLALVKEYKHEKFREEEKEIQLLLEWLDVFREYREYGKLISTYTSYPLRSDGRCHSQFLVHGTATGRLASRKPNLQNIPKKHLEARKPFISRDGHTLLSADYSNLEVRVLAYETNDDVLIHMVENGINIHDENTRILFGLTPEDALWPLARRASKIFQFGGISYGGSDSEIHSKILMEVPKLPLTLLKYRQAKERWMGVHTKYREWETRIRSGVHIRRTTTTFCGRTRTLHGSERDIEKQALNTPIQGGAAHIINRALIRLHHRKQELGLASKLVLQVHDQLIYECTNEELEVMTKLVKEEMERPIDYHGTLRSFPVDIEVGTSWGDLSAPDNDVEDEVEDTSTV